MPHRDPYPETARAPYALPDGVPALQEDPQRVRRRVVLASLCGAAFGVAALCAGQYWSRARAMERAAADDPLLAWGQRIVRSSEEALIANTVAFLAVAESYPSDPLLLRGIERLLERSERDPELEIQSIALRERLTRTLGVCGPYLPHSVRARIRALTRERK